MYCRESVAGHKAYLCGNCEVNNLLELLETVREYITIAWNYLQPVMVYPAVTLICLALFFRYYRKAARPRAGTTEWIQGEISKSNLTFFTVRHKMGKKDIAPLAVITAVFAFLALFKLGDTVAPQSFFQFTSSNRSITIEISEPEEISSFMFYTGLWTGSYALELSDDGLIWYMQKPVESKKPGESPTPAMNQPHSHLFKWRYASLGDDNPAAKYIRITASKTPMELGELALFGADGKLIPLRRISSPDAPELFDEQNLIPEKPSYMNSMYFDEIYHGRTALEHLRNIRPYETTHPPLGKEIIAASIYVFGMTPFGWRFPGAVFGVLMIIVMYIFLKNLFGKTIISICGSLLFGFDFMRFVQTRIATIDTYGVFFILLAYFFMYRYVTTDADARFRKSVVPLALSGLSFGLGCASKWIVVYAGIGLAVIYVIRLVQLAVYYNKDGRPGFASYLVKTLLFSVLFFCVIPAAIYCLSYIPYGLAQGMAIGDGMLWDSEFYKIIWDNQVSMFEYHGKLVAEHPYSSQWWQWILDGRPILYVNDYDGLMRSSFSAFGNPVVWWGGFLAMIAVTIRMVKYRDGKAMFILIGYLSQLLPWVVISRIVFIYHYFPSTLFLVLALAHVFNTIYESGKGRYKLAVVGYTTAAGVLFAAFYPALTGISVHQTYFRNFLRWFPGAWPM